MEGDNLVCKTCGNDSFLKVN